MAQAPKPGAPKPGAPKPRSRTIPAAYHAAVIAQLKLPNPDTQRPFTCAEVAAWLESEHKLRVSPRAVARLRVAVEKHTDAQQVEAWRVEIRDALGPAKLKLERAMKRVDTLLRKSKSLRDSAAAVNAYARVIREFASLSGVAAPTQIDVNSTGPITLVWPDAPAEEPDDPPPDAPPEAG